MIFSKCVEEPIYAKRYKLEDPIFSDHDVTIYIECEKNPHSKGSNDYYLISFYFSVDDYGTRNHIIGVCAGNPNMTQSELDDEIDRYFEGSITDDILEDVDMYLKKEKIIEQWNSEMFDD